MHNYLSDPADDLPPRFAVTLKILVVCAVLLSGQTAWSFSETAQTANSSTGAAAVVETAPADAANAVQTVNVTAKVRPVQSAIDRKTYQVGADLQSVTGSAADVLQSIPSVEVDADGNVSLRGDNRVIILVDGKPSAQLSGANAGDGLLQFSASDIDKVEVMTSAPAEYGADGTAGVINLITKKNRQQGSSGTLMFNAGNERRYVSEANGAINTDSLSLSGGIGLRQDDRQRTVTTRIDAPESVPQYSDGQLQENARRLIPAIKGAVEYRFDESASLGYDVKMRQRSGYRYYDSQNTATLSDGQLASAATGHSDGHEWSLSGEQRLRFRQNLSSPEEVLELSLHRTTDNERERYFLLTQSSFPDAAVSGSHLYQNHRFATNDVSVDYRAPLGEDRNLKLGYSVRHDNDGFDNAGSSLDPITGLWRADPTLNNQFSYVQTVHALYGSLQQPVGSAQLLLGLRAEHTGNEGDQFNAGVVNRHSYGGLYPSVHIEQQVDAQSLLSLVYSRRLSRPDPDDLNPYVDYRDPHNLQSGNPDLRPQQSQSLEAGYQVEAGKQNYGITAYLKQLTDSFSIETTLVSPDVVLTTKTNLPHSRAAGFELNADGPLSPSLSYRLSGNLYYVEADSSASGVKTQLSATGLNLKSSMDYHISPQDNLQLSATRTDRQLTAQGYVEAINLVNVGYKHQLRSGLAMVLTVSDLFNGQRQQRFVNTAALTESYEKFQVGRIAYLGFIYTFGAQKKTKAENFEYDQP